MSKNLITGVMERWSNGVLGKAFQYLLVPIAPLLQYSIKNFNDHKRLAKIRPNRV
jgi:hypothetical protein